MKRVNLVILQLLMFVVGVYGVAMAQEQPQQDQSSEQINKYESFVFDLFTKYYQKGLDEKLYLQIDKPYYSGGEQIWFKGYLLNAITHAPIRLSNFIYAELLDRSGELVSRVKVKRDSTGFNGYIALDPEIEAGDYTLRGYTLWQTNMSPDYFFTKNIVIVSPIPKNANNEQEESTRRESARRVTKQEAEEAEAALKAMEYDLQFFPEGGLLLPNVPQVVAFKAIGADGMSVDVEGSYYSASGGKLGDLKSTHNGMGLMTLMPSAEDQYYALVTANGGEERRFDIPAVDPQGATLKVSKVGSKVYFQVLTTNADILTDSYIVIHSRGRIVSILEGDNLTARNISESTLHDGVSVISLINANNKVLAERVVFKRPYELPEMSIVADKSDYARREKASVTVTVKDLNGAPAKGEFGVSVTDSGSIEIDPASDNVLSYLLLSSEIKGHVEDPGLYFADGSAEHDRNLDLLMRTQAWRRFDMEEVLNDAVPLRKLGYEAETTLTGSVDGFFGNKARNPSISIFSADNGYVDIFTLEDSNSFRLVGLDVPDSTTYVVQARGRNGGNSVTLKLKEEPPFPDPVAGVFERELIKYVPLSFVNQSQEKFVYEGGMSMINLEAITVTREPEPENPYRAFATASKSSAELEELISVPILEIIQEWPSMQVLAEGVMYRSGPNYVRFSVDGVDAEFTEIESLTSSDIQSLDFLTGADAAIFSDASGGVIVIAMREGASFNKAEPVNRVSWSPLGYQRAKEFYQPRYEVASLKANLPPDYRTTIYWDGHLTPDENGVIKVEFFTADKPANYQIVVEGVTETGEICIGSSTMTRTRAN